MKALLLTAFIVYVGIAMFLGSFNPAMWAR